MGLAGIRSALSNLEIHRPIVAPAALAHGMIRQRPSYLAYAVPFVNVGVIWWVRHRCPRAA
jgi:uncharacterized membrane protein